MPSANSAIGWRPGQSVIVLLGVFLAASAVILMNLSWFDEPLLPEIEALRESRPVSPESNGYPLALGFLAGDDRAMDAAGAQIVTALLTRRERGEPATLSKEEMQSILGTRVANEGFNDSLGFACQARHRLDCADRLVARIASLDLVNSRLELLFDRYETLLRQAHFIETPEPEFQTPWPPFGEMVALGRLRLAISFRSDSTPVFLEKASRELAFWRTVLREGERLGTKMVALAAVRNAHDFVSALLRDRDLDTRDLARLRGFMPRFTREESDIGVAFLSETRAYLLSGVPPESAQASWATRLLLQENATFNQYFRETIAPLRSRASLEPREYFERHAYEPLRRELRLTPALLYNFGGKMLLSSSTWDPHQFASRVHDEDGRIELILLQAEIEEHPERDVATVVRSSEHRNPYTGKAMEYDAAANTIGFTCLHTAFHPPELADQCAVALGPDDAQ